MKRFLLLKSSLLVIAFFDQIYCFSPFEGTPCHDVCGVSQSISSNDFVCSDGDFSNTNNGRTLKQCLTCLETSTFQNGPTTDFNLFLYRISSIQQNCLTGQPTPPISNCSSQCVNISTTFSDLSTLNFFQSPFSYCTADSGAYTNVASGCSKCLQAQPDTVILGKLVDAGKTSCENQAAILDGTFGGFRIDLFNATPITTQPVLSPSASSTSRVLPSGSKTTASTATEATVTTSKLRTTNSAAATSSSNTNTSAVEANGGNQALSRGVAAGIGIVIGLLGVTTIIVVAILARRRLANRQEGNEQLWRKMSESPEMTQSTEAAGAVDFAMVPPAAVHRRSIKSIRSLRSWKNANATMLGWYNTAYPKKSSDLSALPQRGWD